MKLPSQFSANALIELFNSVETEKSEGTFTTLWQHDVTRFKGAINYLINTKEKNITNTVIQKVKDNVDILKFIQQSFIQVGPKTSSFYMKFIAWIFELPILPIAIDQHVYNSLEKYNILDNRNYTSAVNVILKIAQHLNISPIFVETALYEESWQKSKKNKRTRKCS